MLCFHIYIFFFFFNDTATTEIYTLSLHDALPISAVVKDGAVPISLLEAGPLGIGWLRPTALFSLEGLDSISHRSEEHTSELQSRLHLVCRLLLEKKKKKKKMR